MNSTNKKYKNEKFVWFAGNTFQRSVKSISLFKFLFVIILSILFETQNLFAWSEHPMLVRPALKDHPVWKTTGKVEAQNLKTFLIQVEKELEVFMAQQEKWSNENLPNYSPTPENLLFRATGNPDDILLRFYSAIRINPDVKIPLYLHLLPNENAGGRKNASPGDITTLEDISSMKHTSYVWIMENEEVFPFDVW
jgi:hypothetical protein